MDIQGLLQKIEKLLAIHNDLRRQNDALRNSEAQWQLERVKLMQQNEIARRKVNEMIERLQVLERNSG
ncbi:MAG TPA: DUF904 domain-containing protein [Pseudomonadales bacterium]|nr:DUF904 domain-containing protein [Pseudomonadales bacterium]